MSKTFYITGTDLRGGSVSSKYRQFLSNAISPPGGTFVDTFTPITFSPVTYTNTVNVSGGGAALQTAINAAASGDRLLIMDSLDYSAISIASKTDLTIEANTGQTPTITAAAGAGNHCVTFGNLNDGVKFIGIHFIGTGNVDTVTPLSNGLISGSVTGTGMTAFSRLQVVRCTFTETVPANGTIGILMVGGNGGAHRSVEIEHCTFTDNGCSTSGLANLAVITVAGFDTGVFIRNIKIQRVTVARASSAMKGVVTNNILSTIQDVLCYDLGTSGTGENFWHTTTFGTPVSSTTTWSNCVVYNGKRPFRLTNASGTVTANHCTVYTDLNTILSGQTIFLRSAAGSFTVTNSVVDGGGAGTAFSATITAENHNDIYNVTAAGVVLDGTDLTVDPVFSGTASNDYRATDAAVAVGGTGGTPMGVYYPGGPDTVFWAGVP